MHILQIRSHLVIPCDSSKIPYDTVIPPGDSCDS